MTKKELIAINKIKRLTVADVKTVSKDKMYCYGYKHGFNKCRRLIKKTLGLI